MLRNIGLVQAHLNPELHVSTVVLTMYDGRTKLADQVAEEVRGHFGDAVLKSVIPRSVKVSEAPGFGMTVLDYDPGSRGAMSYLDAGREMAARSAAMDERRGGVTLVAAKAEGAAASAIPTGRRRQGRRMLQGRGIWRRIDPHRSADGPRQLGSAAANAVIGLDPIATASRIGYLHRGPMPPRNPTGAVYREIRPTRSSGIPSSRARSSKKRRSPNSYIRSGNSG